MPVRFSDHSSSSTAKLKKVGIALAVLGGLCILLDIISVVFWSSSMKTINDAPGIYTGLWAVGAGVLAIFISKKTTQERVFVAIIVCLVLFVLSIYMTVWEFSATFMAGRLKIIGSVITHVLVAVAGIGIFALNCFTAYYCYRTRAIFN